jgi:TPP-dependent pyruvate/acetoin dehydrogenase alpha subunit
MDKKIDTNVMASIEEALQFAKESPLPLPEEATQDVFC